MNDDVYVKLREFMNTLPAGYPSTPSGVEIRILKKLFSPEEAELTTQLRTEPEEVASIAARLGLEEAGLAKKLEAMAQKGLIFRVRKENKVLYQAIQFIVGVYEFQLNHLDEEFCRMFEEYLPYFGMSLMAVKTKQLRVLPVESAMKATPVVETYNRAREMIDGQELFSVSPCICRKEREVLGKKCDRPQETCLGFGDIAQFYIDNHMGRAISKSEALKILDFAEASGLVLSPTNSQEIAALCCCCPCCCPTLKYAKLMPRPVDMVMSYYQAAINVDLCTNCGLCPERCQMAAIKEGSESYQILDGRCIGCGLCVSVCPTEAISLLPKPGMTPPPKNFLQDTLSAIKAERHAMKAR